MMAQDAEKPVFTTADHLRARRIRGDESEEALQAQAQLPPALPPFLPRDRAHYPAQLRIDDLEVFGTWDGKLELAPVTGEPRRLQVAHGALTELVVAPDGSALLVAGEHWHGDLWPLPEGDPVRLVDDQVLTACFSSDGSAVAVATRGLRISVFDRGGSLLWRTELDWEADGERPERLTFTAGDRWLSVQGDAGTQRAWRLGEGAPVLDEQGKPVPGTAHPAGRRRKRPPPVPPAVGWVGVCLLFAGLIELSFGWVMGGLSWLAAGMAFTEALLNNSSGAVMGLLGLLLAPFSLVELVLGMVVLVEPRATRSWVRWLPWATAMLLLLGGVTSFCFAVVMWLLLRGSKVSLWIMGEEWRDDVVDCAGDGGTGGDAGADHGGSGLDRPVT